MSYYDRIDSATDGEEPCHELLAVTSLYLAVKLFEKKRGFLGGLLCDFVVMSKGRFVAEDITKMEMEILELLLWRVHPTTPQLFSCHFLKLFSRSSSMSKSSIQMILEVSNFIIELALFDSSLIIEKPSSIASAAILIAMKGMNDTKKSKAAQASFITMTLSVGHACPEEDLSTLEDKMNGCYESHTKAILREIQASLDTRMVY